jgi:predicted branched-subunit amino acid permease
LPTLQDLLAHPALRPLFGMPGGQADVRRRAFGDGLRDFAPTALGTAVWSLVTAVTTVKLGFDVPHALAMNVLVYAASAQLAAMPLIVGGAPIWLVLLTASIVNLRFVIFSAGLHPYFKTLRLSRRLALGYLTSDLGYLLAVRRWGDDAHAHDSLTERTWYYLGPALGNWVTWVSMAVIGTLLADHVPTGWGLDFVGVLALTAVVVPSIADAPSIAGAAVAGAVGLLARGLPLKLAVLAAVVSGVAAAMLAERIRAHRQ